MIRAFNDDLPYDRFVKEQIAGDLLNGQRVSPNGKQLETPVATGLFGLGEERNGATDLGEVRAEKMDSRIDVFGKAFLGLTIACAKCHDHKFDPIPTSDYYSLGGIFESTQLLLGSPGIAGGTPRGGGSSQAAGGDKRTDSRAVRQLALRPGRGAPAGADAGAEQARAREVGCLFEECRPGPEPSLLSTDEAGGYAAFRVSGEARHGTKRNRSVYGEGRSEQAGQRRSGVR